MSHYDRSSITFYPEGQLTVQRFRAGVHYSHGLRGRVSRFSSSSRGRLMKRLSMVRKNEIPLFVTLTYHVDYGLPFEEYKEHLRRFGIYMKRRFPKMGFIWKLEFQKRGTQHFHLFLWGVPFEMRHVVAAIWTAIVDPGNGMHKNFHMGVLGNEHCVKRVSDFRGMKSYCSKYMMKASQAGAPSGRYWGMVGSVPLAAPVSFVVSRETGFALRSVIQRETGMQSRSLGYWAGAFNVDWLIYLNWLVDCEEGPPEPLPRWELIMLDEVVVYTPKKPAEPVQKFFPGF